MKFDANKIWSLLVWSGSGNSCGPQGSRVKKKKAPARDAGLFKSVVGETDCENRDLAEKGRFCKGNWLLKTPPLKP